MSDKEACKAARTPPMTPRALAMKPDPELSEGEVRQTSTCSLNSSSDTPVNCLLQIGQSYCAIDKVAVLIAAYDPSEEEEETARAGAGAGEKAALDRLAAKETAGAAGAGEKAEFDRLATEGTT
ncbi:hypothetical protein CAOG_010011 [Capsaspora owczarzaki ATCC 30864]|uniref:Uncharacterized protein n=1 Tax=Capsaspora owczarzaki (strain ATCC 30864) TaxID=595528 RepID=A0A0D2WVQ8_CAPO3|nr:hypothetical protein CAOG_010011 [Capsaspora owczarzaki ATCC 30864]